MLPALSVYRYCKIYVHIVLVSTDPLLGVATLPLPSTLSVRVAPSSVYVHPNGTVITALPFRVATGAF